MAPVVDVFLSCASGEGVGRHRYTNYEEVGDAKLVLFCPCAAVLHLVWLFVYISSSFLFCRSL